MSVPCEELRRFHRSRERVSAQQRVRLPLQRRALQAKALAVLATSKAKAIEGNTKLRAQFFASNHPESWRSASAGQFIQCRAARQGGVMWGGSCVAGDRRGPRRCSYLVVIDFPLLEVRNGSMFPALFHLGACGYSSPSIAIRRTAKC